MTTAQPSLREILAKSIRFLTEKQIDSPRLSAELVIAQALGMSRLDLFLDLDKPLREAELSRIRPLLVRRGTGEPIAYILGHKEFYGLSFHVTPEVLIPRPDTELGVDLALKLFRKDAPVFFADVGTGSGVLATTLLTLLPQAQCVAMDISSGALTVAKRNLQQHGVNGRCLLVHGNLLDHVAPRRLDLIVANLPYIGEGEAGTLSPEITGFEPPMALFGGPQGDELFAPLFATAQEVLVDGGFLLLEIGASQAQRLRGVIQSMSARWSDISVHTDLAGHQRYIQARLV